MSLFETKFNEILHTFTEITDNNGKTIDNVKINDIVKTPDGTVGRYIKKKEYAILDLGNGQIKEAEIDSLQLIEPAEEDEPDKQSESVITEDGQFSQTKLLYVVGFEENDVTYYRSGMDDTTEIWSAEMFESEQEAQAEIDYEVQHEIGKSDEYFIKPVQLNY